MELVKKFLTGLKSALPPDELKELDVATGAGIEDINELKLKYPKCPKSLIYLLQNIDGTYWRQYGEKKISVCILASDVSGGSYPYYLMSVQQMLESSQEDEDVSYLLEDEEEDDEVVDPKINLEGLLSGTYIHFADCMNNGGTSRLYIDFNPSDKGICGQIVRYLHDPDEYKVIADSFDEYLQDLIDNDFIYLKDEEE